MPARSSRRHSSVIRFALGLTLSLLLVSAKASAEERPRPYFAHANLAFNVVTWLGPLKEKPATTLTPANRAILIEQVGFGYFLNQHFRLQLTLLLGETLTNRPAGTSPLAVGSALPLLVFMQGPFWVAGGPAVAFQSSGVTHLDLGMFLAVGWAFPLGAGFTLSPALTHLGLYYQRVSLGLSPSVALGYRF